jgi:hypothetical protein
MSSYATPEAAHDEVDDDREEREAAYLGLRDASLDVWQDLRAYLDEVGSTLLNRCTFAQFVQFAEKSTGLEDVL